jgi:amino acid permease
MKKILPIIIICILFLAIGLVVNALTIENPLKYDKIDDIIKAVMDFIAIVGSSIAVIMVIWGGIVYMTAGSSEEKTKNAKKTIQWALTGLAIVWSAKFLIDLLAWVLGKE